MGKKFLNSCGPRRLGRAEATLTSTETELVMAYRCSSSASDRTSIIRRYADLAHLSMGRAEDALDLWAYMLARHIARA